MSLINQETGRTATEERSRGRTLKHGTPLKKTLHSYKQRIDNAQVPQEPEPSSLEQLKMEMDSEGTTLTEQTLLPTLEEILDMLTRDSELTIQKAQSAALLVQVKRFQEHYQKFENMIQDLIRENQEVNKELLTGIAEKIMELKTSNQILQSQLKSEVSHVAAEMTYAMKEQVKQELRSSLDAVKRTTRSMESLGNVVQNFYVKFQWMEGIRFVLFTLCCISSPIMTILILLDQFNVISWLK